MARRLHSPYKHWVEGLFSELAVLSGFMAFLVVLSVAVAWLVR